MARKAHILRNFIIIFISFELAILRKLTYCLESPRFSAPISNVTTAVGREAILKCLVDGLGIYKVAWLRVDTQTILTIQNHVITKNHRIGITHSEHKTWFLHIKEVKATDKGGYMCQINTDPMKSQVGFLDVVVPPNIDDNLTSPDSVVREGANVRLKCMANGCPTPSITWKRENGLIVLPNRKEVQSTEGSLLNLTQVKRQQMGPYLCIASNGIPPSVSKRITLIVEFPPNVSITNELVGTYDGQNLTLECRTEAYPKSINYWINVKGDIITENSGKYEVGRVAYDLFRSKMNITIRNISQTDFGQYKCVAKNALGETEGNMQLYRIPHLPEFINPTHLEDPDQTRLLLTNSKYSPSSSSIFYNNSVMLCYYVGLLLPLFWVR